MKLTPLIFIFLATVAKGQTRDSLRMSDFTTAPGRAFDLPIFQDMKRKELEQNPESKRIYLPDYNALIIVSKDCSPEVIALLKEAIEIARKKLKTQP